MEIIEKLLYLTNDYWILSLVIGFLVSFVESYIPALPLTAIVAINAAINGFIPGFLISWIGSCIGTSSLYYLIKKFMLKRNVKFINKILNSDKFDNMSDKIEKREFPVIFAFYMIPFLPSSAITLTAAFCKIDYKIFIPPMIFGKFLMMFIVSYVGDDITNIFENPTKLVVVTIITVVSYILATRIKNKLELHEDAAKSKYKAYKDKRTK